MVNAVGTVFLTARHYFKIYVLLSCEQCKNVKEIDFLKQLFGGISDLVREKREICHSVHVLKNF